VANINVSYADMDGAASDLKAGQADIEDRLQALQRKIQQLISDGYVTDKSSVAFGQSYDEFNRGVTQTVQGLEGLSSYLKKASQTLSETDQSLASGLQG
jgi:WXG100 family type VII secretion target